LLTDIACVVEGDTQYNVMHVCQNK